MPPYIAYTSMPIQEEKIIIIIGDNFFCHLRFRIWSMMKRTTRIPRPRMSRCIDVVRFLKPSTVPRNMVIAAAKIRPTTQGLTPLKKAWTPLYFRKP